MKAIRYCIVCKNTVSAEMSVATVLCPICKSKTYKTSVDSAVYNSLSETDKQTWRYRWDDLFNDGKCVYDKDGYDKAGYDWSGYNRSGLDCRGFDRNGINRSSQSSFDKDGYDHLGYNKDGLNKAGFDREGIHFETHTQYGPDGYDVSGYNSVGFGRDGYNRDGFDESGFDREGFDSKGYNKVGFDRNGYNKDGFDCNGYNKQGYDRNGFDKYGFNIKGFDRTWHDHNGYTPADREMLTRIKDLEDSVSMIQRLDRDRLHEKYEYRVLSYVDENSGGVNVSEMQRDFQTLGSAGWKLVGSYSNTIGVNSSSSGAYGISSGTNATIDQNIFVFQRKIV